MKLTKRMRQYLAHAGSLGGHARAKALSPERITEIAKQANLARHAKLGGPRRSEIARKAALARWRGKRKK